MFLKKVEIAGFKSFANKTVIDFAPSLNEDGRLNSSVKLSGGKNPVGITAIVGPNGSGKSNIADAIRWAMGEQSMKNLRGKKSEDIIFAGSGKKGRLGYATVSLHFDNSDKKIPVDFSEVIVKRKLFRSGESEYSINGNKVRLIDVVDILAKAGVGKDSYSVINQGMSDAVLRATPLERKTILEDAAGVKQYQIKKYRALKKLDTTLKNLQQVDSLLTEIEPHLRRLERQVRRAEKGKVLKKELRELQKKYYAWLWFDFQKKQGESVETKDSLGREMMNVQKEVDKLNDFIAGESAKMRQNEEVDNLKKEKENLYREVNDLEREKSVLEGKLEIAEEKMREQMKIKSVPVDKGYIQRKLKNIYGEYAELVKKIGGAETMAEVRKLQDDFKKLKELIFGLQGDIQKGAVEEKMSEAGNEEVRKLQKAIDTGQKQKRKIVDKIVDLQNKISKIDKKIAEEVERDRVAREDFFKKEESLRQKRRELDRLKDKFNEAKISLAKIEVREEDLKNEARNELKIDIEKLKFTGDKINATEAEQRIFKIKSQLSQIGEVDKLTVEEYEETKERYETLRQESEDLQKAIVSLEKIAKEMDREIEKVFGKAFVRINKEFSKYFRIIFGGGKAQLKKVKIKRKVEKMNQDDEVDGEDIIADDEAGKDEEIGVEIVACPPGKKINSLAMLSGGERSLTSLALLFAIISYNPPPFAVLDEVEAALDEANSTRFSKILRKLADNTQFVAITHNRETMRQASYLYGATMGDDGITKLLSVKLEEVAS